MSGPLHKIQASFSGGEFSPSLYARVDIAKYLTGLKTARNVNVLPQGGVRNRPGTVMVATAGSSAHAVRLVKFVSSTQAAYILEFGQYYIRFYTSDAQIQASSTVTAWVTLHVYAVADFVTQSGTTYYCLTAHTSGTFATDLAAGKWVAQTAYQIVSPYLGTDLADLKFTQSADTLYIAHQSYAPEQLTRTAADNWTIAAFSFANGPFMLQNTVTTYKLAVGLDGFGNPKITASGFAPFVANHVGSWWDVSAPIPGQNVDKTFTATAQTSTYILCGHTWRLVTNGIWRGTITIQESHDGGVVWNNLRTLQGNSDINFDTSGETGQDKCLVRLLSGVFGAVAWSGTLYGNLCSDAFEAHYIAQATAFTSTTVINFATSSDWIWGQFASLGINVSTWSEGSWSLVRGWPACCVFFQDRLHFASTVTEPQTVWASQTALYTDYGVSEPLVDSDAISLLLPSRQVNVVKNLVVISNLIALTSDAEFSIAPGSAGSYTPFSLDVQCVSHRGSGDIDPAMIGNEIILMQQMGTVVRNFIFQLAVQGYMGDNISLISQHLFTGYQIVAMDFQQEPDSVVWAVRDDGVLLSLTYLREQEVSAWTHHDTPNGLFESVAVIPNPTLSINEVWLVVNRSGTRYIERMKPRDQGTDPADQFFVDCGLSYSGSPATVITGLSHLNGKSVSVLADGNVIASPNNSSYDLMTVAGGQITLPVAASEVHVGLPFVSDIETLKIEAPDNKGTLQGRRVAIPQATLRFWNSRGGFLGPQAPSDDGTSGLDPIIQRDESDNYGAPIALKTEDYLQTIDGGYAFGARMFFRQVDPLPVALLGIIPQIVPGEN